jgi:hypothetical protein
MKNAQQCMEEATRAGSQEAKDEYLQLAKAWMQLAEELDGVRKEAALKPLRNLN